MIHVLIDDEMIHELLVALWCMPTYWGYDIWRINDIAINVSILILWHLKLKYKWYYDICCSIAIMIYEVLYNLRYIR